MKKICLFLFLGLVIVSCAQNTRNNTSISEEHQGPEPVAYISSNLHLEYKYGRLTFTFDNISESYSDYYFYYSKFELTTWDWIKNDYSDKYYPIQGIPNIINAVDWKGDVDKDPCRKLCEIITEDTDGDGVPDDGVLKVRFRVLDTYLNLIQVVEIDAWKIAFPDELDEHKYDIPIENIPIYNLEWIS
ncbi:MAG: hypothetical protein IKX23_00270 [Treponema sp.]|nr:hypothetical protein [Treponema sp.]